MKLYIMSKGRACTDEKIYADSEREAQQILARRFNTPSNIWRAIGYYECETGRGK